MSKLKRRLAKRARARVASPYINLPDAARYNVWISDARWLLKEAQALETECLGYKEIGKGLRRSGMSVLPRDTLRWLSHAVLHSIAVRVQALTEPTNDCYSLMVLMHDLIKYPQLLVYENWIRANPEADDVTPSDYEELWEGSDSKSRETTLAKILQAADESREEVKEWVERESAHYSRAPSATPSVAGNVLFAGDKIIRLIRRIHRLIENEDIPTRRQSSLGIIREKRASS